MKDRQGSKATMNSMLPKTALENQKSKTESNLQAFKSTPEYVAQAKEYNSKVEVLDELYTSIRPNHQLIVRCFLIEPFVSESGLISPFKETLEIPTKSGVGASREFETDWPYNTKGVVVAVPQGMTSLKVGEIVQLNPRAIQIALKGNAQNAQVIVANGFMHVDSGLFSPPKDLTSPHYGYVLVTPQDIQAIYPKNEVLPISYGGIGTSNDLIYTSPFVVNGTGNMVVSDVTDSNLTIS